MFSSFIFVLLPFTEISVVMEQRQVLLGIFVSKITNDGESNVLFAVQFYSTEMVKTFKTNTFWGGLKLKIQTNL